MHKNAIRISRDKTKRGLLLCVSRYQLGLVFDSSPLVSRMPRRAVACGQKTSIKTALSSLTIPLPRYSEACLAKQCSFDEVLAFFSTKGRGLRSKD